MSFAQIQAHWQRLRQSAVFYGIFATGIRVGANLLLLPLLLSKLPTAELALWWVLVALGAFANLADFGFGPAISRVYSCLWAGADDFDAEGLRPPPQSQQPNVPRIRQLSETVRFFYWRMSLGATLLLAVVGTFFLLKPCSALAQPHLGWLAWVAYVLTIGYNLGTSRWVFACQGLGRVRELQAAYLWSGVCYVGCAVALLLAGWGVLALVAANFLKGFITREYCRKVYYAAVPRVPTSDMKPDPEMLRRLWPNASKLGITALGGFFLANGNVLISSTFLGDKVTASFGLTVQIGTFLMSFAGLWLTVRWPQVAMLRTQGRLQEMSILFARRLAFTMATFVALATMVVVLGNWLLEWKGTHTQMLPTPALVFYFAYLTQQLFYVQFGMLAFTENIVPFFKISIFTGLGMLVLSLVMARTFGLWGLLIAPLVAESTCSSWFTVRRGFQGQSLSPRQFLKVALSGQL